MENESMEKIVQTKNSNQAIITFKISSWETRHEEYVKITQRL